MTAEKVDKKDPPTFRELMGTEMVDIYVGVNKEHFRVHKEILCVKIPYFEKMFKGGFKESADGSATFPDDSPESFDLLLSWVYHNTIRSLSSKTNGKGYEEMSWGMVSFYGLAEKLCLPALQDRIVDTFRGYH